MKVLHISPTYFSDQSIVGGGERYPFELAKSMSKKVEVVLLTFSDKAESVEADGLRIQYLQLSRFISDDPLSLNPIAPCLWKWLNWADVIHCHQVHTHITSVALIAGQLLNKRVFLTDLGGGTKRALTYYMPLYNFADALLLLSNYSSDLWKQVKPKFGRSHINRIEVVYGGVDTDKFCPGHESRTKSALFVGRLLPHKGIDYAIDAIDGDLSLNVVGRMYDQSYYDFLCERSLGRNITFQHNCTDAEIIGKFQRALVTIVPSVYQSRLGGYTSVPELLGLVAMESMSCGTPVIVSNVASLPEIVIDGVTGFIVPPNNALAIKEKLLYLRDNPASLETMSKRCREIVTSRYRWDIISEHCLTAYKA